MSEPTRPAAAHSGDQEPRRIDVAERGALRDGQPQIMDRRLFMQLLVFHAAEDSDPAVLARSLGRAVAERGTGVVIYEDVGDPWGIGLLTWGEDPAVFVDAVRPAVISTSPGALRPRPELTMMGRTYSTGYEADLEQWILRRPPETVCNPAWPWAVWYPLRRSGAFARLEGREQGGIAITSL
jgi:hypothetical protein